MEQFLIQFNEKNKEAQKAVFSENGTFSAWPSLLLLYSWMRAEYSIASLLFSDFMTFLRVAQDVWGLQFVKLSKEDEGNIPEAVSTKVKGFVGPFLATYMPQALAVFKHYCSRYMTAVSKMELTTVYFVKLSWSEYLKSVGRVDDFIGRVRAILGKYIDNLKVMESITQDMDALCELFKNPEIIRSINHCFGKCCLQLGDKLRRFDETMFYSFENKHLNSVSYQKALQNFQHLSYVIILEKCISKKLSMRVLNIPSYLADIVYHEVYSSVIRNQYFTMTCIYDASSIKAPDDKDWTPEYQISEFRRTLFCKAGLSRQQIIIMDAICCLEERRPRKVFNAIQLRDEALNVPELSSDDARKILEKLTIKTITDGRSRALAKLKSFYASPTGAQFFSAYGVDPIMRHKTK